MIMITDDLSELEEDDLLESTESSHSLYEHHRFVSDNGQGLVRIDKFLNDRIINSSRTKIQEAAEAGNILVNGNKVKANYRVKPKDVISIVMAYPPREVEIIAQDIPLNIVYEDDDLMVINKPAGLVVHPGHGNYDGTLVNALAYYFRNNANYNVADPRLGLVHRIDKNTSGLLLIAKNEYAKIVLAKQFFDKTTERVYKAVVWGSFHENEGTIKGHIARSIKDRMQMDVFPNGEVGKHAVTHYKVIESFNYVTLVECRLETGRTHQIRAHMKYIGHPLFNDERYGGNIILKGTTFNKYKQFVQNCFDTCPRQALHAQTLGFTHPTTQEKLFFTSDMPDDMELLIEKWKNYTTSYTNL
jgi:23S rRNA pseudouridine1911/1915/1917 synthase